MSKPGGGAKGGAFGRWRRLNSEFGKWNAELKILSKEYEGRGQTCAARLEAEKRSKLKAECSKRVENGEYRRLEGSALSVALLKPHATYDGIKLL